MKGGTLGNIDLTPGQLKLVKKLLRKHLPNTEVWAYGSRVKFSSRPDSDLDMVAFATPEQATDVMLLKEAFEESDLPFTVDFFVWDEVPESFHKSIEREHFILQKVNGKVPAQTLPSGDRVGPHNPAPRQIMSDNTTSPSEWCEVALQDAAHINPREALPKGQHFKKIDMDALLPFTKKIAKHVVRDYRGGAKFRNGDTLIARITPCLENGKTAFVDCLDADEVAFGSTEFIVLREKLGVSDCQFLYYLAISQPFRNVAIQSMTGTSGRQRVTLDQVKRYKFHLPPMQEQRAIAHILGTLDDKIELNRRMSETLEAMAQALFKSWFIDFDPVHAKVAGQDPGLPAHISALFPNRFEESEQGPIPAGWQTGRIGDTFDLTMGQSPPSKSYNETGDGLPFYQGRADFQFRFPGKRIYCTEPTRLANAGDTLVSVRAPVGDINMALEDCAIGRGVAAIRHKSDSRSYTYHFMRSLAHIFAPYKDEGTVFGSISKKDFQAIPCINPPQTVIQAFEQLCAPWDSQVELNERTSCTLSSTRDTMLPRFLSGAQRVSMGHVRCEEAHNE